MKLKGPTRQKLFVLHSLRVLPIPRWPDKIIHVANLASTYQTRFDLVLWGPASTSRNTTSLRIPPICQANYGIADFVAPQSSGTGNARSWAERTGQTVTVTARRELACIWSSYSKKFARQHAPCDYYPNVLATRQAIEHVRVRKRQPFCMQ
jgi:hypothetical protein